MENRVLPSPVSVCLDWRSLGKQAVLQKEIKIPPWSCCLSGSRHPTGWAQSHPIFQGQAPLGKTILSGAESLVTTRQWQSWVVLPSSTARSLPWAGEEGESGTEEKVRHLRGAVSAWVLANSLEMKEMDGPKSLVFNLFWGTEPSENLTLPTSLLIYLDMLVCMEGISQTELPEVICGLSALDY